MGHAQERPDHPPRRQARLGAKYTFGTTPGADLSLPNNLHYVAGHLGVPLDELRKPLPPGGLAVLDARWVRRPHGAT
ncbi:MAG TPA: hypothetical protein VN853_11615 [Polyangia bacterium]|nr:hypothetical protein [Polyangia bacterium]